MGRNGRDRQMASIARPSPNTGVLRASPEFPRRLVPRTLGRSLRSPGKGGIRDSTNRVLRPRGPRAAHLCRQSEPAWTLSGPNTPLGLRRVPHDGSQRQDGLHRPSDTVMRARGCSRPDRPLLLPSLAELTVPCPGVSGIDVAQKADSEMTPNHRLSLAPPRSSRTTRTTSRRRFVLSIAA